MTTRAAGKGAHSDFSRLFREVQAGHKPIDVLLENATFRRSLREALARVEIATPRWEEGKEKELANWVASTVLREAKRAHDRSQPHLEFDYARELESEFDDLLANMQTAKSKRAVQKAFAASPAQLGRAAVKQASKKR